MRAQPSLYASERGQDTPGQSGLAIEVKAVNLFRTRNRRLWETTVRR